jgi:hypothetical protein
LFVEVIWIKFFYYKILFFYHGVEILS